MKSPRSFRRAAEPAALELIEEAVHLLRRAPPGLFAIYYAGAVPFALALLFFWAHTTWVHPSDSAVAWAALGLVVLFIAMKAMHAEFSSRLLALRLDVPATAWSGRRLVRLILAQLRVQPWALLALLLAMIVIVPFGWVYAYGQSACVLGDAERVHDDAVAQAKLWPGQNHFGLLMIAGVAFCTLLNFGAAFYTVPWLANRLLGFENIFDFSGWSFFNTTFLASIAVLTWLAVDPLVKAFYVLRVFHGRARHSGEDVRIEFRLGRSRFLTLVATLLLFASITPAEKVRGAEPAPATTVETVVSPAELDRSIDEVLASGDFPWRLPPRPQSVAEQNDGPIKSFFRRGVETIREGGRSIWRFVKRVVDWLDQGSSRGDRAERRGGGGGLEILRMLLYLFIAGAVGLIVWLGWLTWQNAVRDSAPILTARIVEPATPDLRDENLQAAQLPVDGWRALAREQAARGEWRLALRALYLGTLARLASEGLLSLARFKTNLDYERELRRRALSRAEIPVRFAARRREFEAVWYGRTETGETEVREWMAELERPIT